MKIKNVALYLGGVGTGLAGAYLYFKAKLSELVNEESERIREGYIDEIEELKAEISNLEVELKAIDCDEITEEKPEPVHESFVKKEHNKTSRQKVNYNDIISKLDTGYFDTEKDLGREPYVISDEDWYDEKDQDKVILTYFPEDGIVINEDEDVMPNGLDLIGEDNLDRAGEFEDGVLFVRNEAAGCDYQVVIEGGSYSSFIGEE